MVEIEAGDLLQTLKPNLSVLVLALALGLVVGLLRFWFWSSGRVAARLCAAD